LMSNEAVRVAKVLGAVCCSAKALGNGEETTSTTIRMRNRFLTFKSESARQDKVRANK
jgi:hypothetical protein